MIPVVRNLNGERIGIIDAFSSFIWTERYYSPGDYEITIPLTKDNLKMVQKNYYIQRDDSNDIGIVEKIELSDEQMIISGRFLTSILGRRIVENQTEFTNESVISIVRSLLSSNMTYPKDSRRQIEMLIYNDTTGFDEKLSIQFTGKNILDIISEFSEKYNVGFKIIDNSSDVNLIKFKLLFYSGKDKSNSVIFSDKFDNLKSIQYFENLTNLTNAVLVAGEGEGSARKKLWVNESESSGLFRYEKFIDSRNTSSNNGQISESDYYGQLKSEGREELITFEKVLNAEVFNEYYKYRKDYNVGDIVSIEHGRIGLKYKPRIVEVVESVKETGEYTIQPTFAL